MVDHHEEVSPATVVPALQAGPEPLCKQLTFIVFSGVLHHPDQQHSSIYCLTSVFPVWNSMVA